MLHQLSNSLICLCIILVSSIGYAHANDQLSGISKQIPYALVDTNSGHILAHNRLDERWHPASLTKLMSAYVVFRAIQSGEISAGSPVFITAKSLNAPPSRMGYKKGTQLRVDNALRILIVKSANDVAIALAESVAGSSEAFVSRMNSEARRLGLTNSQFENANGLQANGQYVSARDMVKLSNAIWNEFPRYREIFATPTIKAGGRLYTSYNLLLERFDGTTGMKTGFICAAGYNIVASAERNGRRLVAVVLGASSQTERAEIAAKLFLFGFNKASGTPMEQIALHSIPKAPPNLRSKLCTQEAREARYDPASENAVIRSDYLHSRKITRQPFVIQTGGIDGDPSPAWYARSFAPTRIPKPTKRPDYAVVNVDGDLVTSSQLLRGSAPLPSPRP